jgi:hypothetical protein
MLGLATQIFQVTDLAFRLALAATTELSILNLLIGGIQYDDGRFSR